MNLLRANVEEAFQRYEMRMENARLARELEDANEELMRINHELEQRVEEKTREVMRNLNILQISQEVLERLPVAVIGIGDDGIIAIANRSAHLLFSEDGTRPLLGEIASDVVPVDLLDCARDEAARKSKKNSLIVLPMEGKPNAGVAPWAKFPCPRVWFS